MSDFWEFIGKALLVSLIVTVSLFFLIILCVAGEDAQNKKECYEIYVTDNVILKKCEKYFKKVVDYD